MAFRKDWRVYQSRLLEHLNRYLDNKRLHLIAAPGSGKTVIGLEVIRRINQPTLVLAPTITIRDQWVERLVDLFLPPGNGKPSWVSTELRNPASLTVATYQALHAVYSGEPEEPPPILTKTAFPRTTSRCTPTAKMPITFPKDTCPSPDF